MNELEKIEKEERIFQQNMTNAIAWGNKNKEIVKRKLGNSYSGNKLVALYLDETQSQPKIKNLWKKEISPTDKDKIYTALSDNNYMEYSGSGKPLVKLKLSYYIFKALHNLKLIKKDLITDDEWNYDFILSEFQRKKRTKKEDEFNRENLKDSKSKNFKQKKEDIHLIEDITKVIQSALNA